jgi:hypothetical protein
MIITRKIRSIYGGSLNTRIQSVKFAKGESKIVKFISESQYNDIVKNGQFVADNVPTSESVNAVPVVVESSVDTNIIIEPPPVVIAASAVATSPVENSAKQEETAVEEDDLPSCPKCGVLLIKVGSDWKCVACGATTPVNSIEAQTIKKRITSKCPMCGKRKRKIQDLCDVCNTTHKVISQ